MISQYYLGILGLELHQEMQKRYSCMNNLSKIYLLPNLIVFPQFTWLALFLEWLSSIISLKLN